MSYTQTAILSGLLFIIFFLLKKVLNSDDNFFLFLAWASAYFPFSIKQFFGDSKNKNNE